MAKVKRSTVGLRALPLKNVTNRIADSRRPKKFSGKPSSGRSFRGSRWYNYPKIRSQCGKCQLVCLCTPVANSTQDLVSLNMPRTPSEESFSQPNIDHESSSTKKRREWREETTLTRQHANKFVIKRRRISQEGQYVLGGAGVAVTSVPPVEPTGSGAPGVVGGQEPVTPPASLGLFPHPSFACQGTYFPHLPQHDQHQHRQKQQKVEEKEQRKLEEEARKAHEVRSQADPAENTPSENSSAELFDFDHTTPYIHGGAIRKYEDSVMKELKRNPENLDMMYTIHDTDKLKRTTRSLLADFLLRLQQDTSLQPSNQTLHQAASIADVYLGHPVMLPDSLFYADGEYTRLQIDPEHDVLLSRLLNWKLMNCMVAPLGYQHIAVTCLYIAHKVESQVNFRPEDFLACLGDNICDFDTDDLLSDEMTILSTIGFRTSLPTSNVFADAYLAKMHVPEDSTLRKLVNFLLDLGLLSHETIPIPASLIATAAILLALNDKGTGLTTETRSGMQKLLINVSKYSIGETLQAQSVLRRMASDVLTMYEESYKYPQLYLSVHTKHEEIINKFACSIHRWRVRSLSDLTDVEDSSSGEQSADDEETETRERLPVLYFNTRSIPNVLGTYR